MNPITYVYALGANLCFALGSQGFTYYSRLYSATWMNGESHLAADAPLKQMKWMNELKKILQLQFIQQHSQMIPNMI